MDGLQGNSLIGGEGRWDRVPCPLSIAVPFIGHHPFGIRFNELRIPQLLDNSIGAIGQGAKLFRRERFIGQDQLLERLLLFHR